MYFHHSKMGIITESINNEKFASVLSYQLCRLA